MTQSFKIEAGFSARQQFEIDLERENSVEILKVFSDFILLQ